MGWTGTDLEEQSVEVSIVKGSIGERSYTATWSIIQYSISYDLKGGTVETANPTTFNVESQTFTLTNPVRDGYDFAGWTGTGLTEPTMTVEIALGSIDDRNYTKGSTGDRAFTANWSPVTYTIDYDLNGSSVATANPTEYTIESQSFILNNPTKAHWVFAGWTGTGLNTATQNVTIALGSTGNRSYTANWERETYTVSISSNVDGMVTASTTTPKYEDDVVLTFGTDEDLDLVSVVIDGIDVTASIDGNNYTIQNVSANVSVIVTYASNKEFITNNKRKSKN